MRDPRAAGKFGLSSIDCLDYRVAASSLETAGDYAVELSNAISKLGKVNKEIVKKTPSSINNVLDLIQDAAMRSFLAKDYTLAQNVFKNYAQFESLLSSLRNQVLDKNLVEILHISVTIEHIGRCQRDIADLDQRIASGLLGPDFIGNSYSASVFVSLDSILENDKEDLGGKTVVLAGYGRGSHALMQANLFAQGSRKEAKKLDMMSRLGQRKKLSIEEYEIIDRGEVPRENCPILSKPRFVLESIGKTGTKEEGDRKYTFVS